MDRIERFFARGLKLGHLRLLMLLDQLGQVQRVAQRLGVTQPAVSRQLAELEAGLGLDVVRRAGNGVVFTEQGRVLLRHARAMLLHLEQARQELDGLTNEVRGVVTIAAVPSLMQTLAQPLALALQRHLPKVTLNFVEDTSDKLFDALLKGSVQLLLSRAVPAQLADGRLHGQILAEDPLVIVCGRQHPLAHCRALTSHHLADCVWLLPPLESPAFQALNTWLHARGISLGAGCLHSSAIGLYRPLLEQGQHLALLPLSAVRRADDRTLVHLELDDAAFLPTLWLYHASEQTTGAARQALECVGELDIASFLGN